MSNTFFVTDQFSAAFPSVHQPSTDGEYASGKYEVSGFLTREANTDGLMSIAAAVQAAEWEAAGCNRSPAGPRGVPV